MIVNQQELSDIRSEHADATLALRFGTYDLLHAGHQLGIDIAASHGDVLVIGVMPDAYVTRAKGPDRPINPAEYRAHAIDEADNVDFTFIAPLGTIALACALGKLRPDVYVEDEEYGAGRIKSIFLRAIGTEYVIDRDSRVASTSQIIAKLGLVQAREKAGLNFLPSFQE